MRHTKTTKDPSGRSAWLRNEWLILAAILFVGLCLRASYLREIMNGPDFAAPTLDPQFNDYWARAMVTGDWTPPANTEDPEIRSTPYGRPPGYPHLLALIYGCSGGSYLAPRLVQIALGLLNCVLAFLLGRSVFNRAAGLIAAALMATYWGFIYFEDELNDPAFTVFLGLLLIMILRRWIDRPRALYLWIAGLLLGAFALCRPNVLLFAPVAAAWIAWVDMHREPRGGAWFGIVVFVIGCVLAVAPALIRNYAVTREFVLISYYGGVNAYIGNNEQAEGASAKIPDIRAISGLDAWNCFTYPHLVRGLRKTLGNDHLTFSEASRYFWMRASDFWRHHPFKAILLTLRKASLFWGPAEVSDSKVIACEKSHSPTLRYLPGFPWFLALGATGFLLLCFGRDREELPGNDRAPGSALIVAFVMSYFLSVLPFFIAGRYRVPIVPFVLLFAAYAVYRIFRFAAGREYRSALVWGGAAAALSVLSNIPVAAYTPEVASWRYQRALAYDMQGRTNLAIAELREAIALAPDYADAHNKLGSELVRSGNFDKALAEFQEALRADPGHAMAHNNLGYELARRGQRADAERHYRAAIERNPDLTVARTNLGNLLADLGRADEAEQVFKEILDRDPRDPHAHYNLGNLYARQGKTDEAIAQFEAALRNSPEDPSVPNNFGLLLATLKRYDEAIRYYRDALRIDPKYAKAYFNLGNVFGELGRLDEAIDAYNKALELAPDLAQARKNLNTVMEAKRKRP